jgi:type IV pilus assembly protein PilQ
VTRRDLSIFAAGLLLGGATTYIVIHQVPRFVVHLFPDKPPVVELETPKASVPAEGQLNFENEDIRSAFQRLAKAAGLKVVISDRVKGSVTMELGEQNDMSPRMAIDVIVESKGLVLDESTDTLYIKTAEERAREPTESGRYTFRNARASEVKKLLVRQLRCQVEPIVDERTNTIFYREDRSNFQTVHDFLEFLDQPVRP